MKRYRVSFDIPAGYLPGDTGEVSSFLMGEVHARFNYANPQRVKCEILDDPSTLINSDACLTCGHQALSHDSVDFEGQCLVQDCDCETLHLDVGDCGPECYGQPVETREPVRYDGPVLP